MKVIICGGRNYQFNFSDWLILDSLHSQWSFTEIVSGACAGADKGGEAWAKSVGLPVKQFPADWALGSKAGPIRNQAMADYADGCVCFPGGQGTRDMLLKALNNKLKVWRVKPIVHKEQ